RHAVPAAAVELVRDDRVAGLAEVDADLMRSASTDSHAHERHAAERFGLEYPGFGRARAPCTRRHLLPPARVAPDRLRHRQAGPHGTPDEGEVLLGHRPILKLLR